MNWKQFFRQKIKSLLTTPANWLVASSTIFARRVDDCLRSTSAMIDNGTLAAKFYPFQSERRSLDLAEFSGHSLGNQSGQFSIPPESLMEGYGPSVQRYIQSGREDCARMAGILAGEGISTSSADPILDFGCAAGRMIRHAYREFPQARLFGADISAEHILWCQTHLSPPGSFLTTTTFPHLPFKDGFFGGVYCGSVFTHIADLVDFWLWELNRILAPGGWIYATIHDRHTIEILQRQYPDFFLSRMVKDYDLETGFLSKPFGMTRLASNPKDAMVFYEHEYIQQHWGRVFDVVGFWKEAYGYQTAVLLRKPKAPEVLPRLL